MAFYMLSAIVFLAAFMEGKKAGAPGVGIGVLVGLGAALCFFYGMKALFVWVPQRLGFSEPKPRRFRMGLGWLLAVVGFIWLVLSCACGVWMTRATVHLIR